MVSWWIYSGFFAQCMFSRLPFPSWMPMQPASANPSLDLCTRYPLQLSGSRQCEMQPYPIFMLVTDFKESNPRPIDLKSDVLSTQPCAQELYAEIRPFLFIDHSAWPLDDCFKLFFFISCIFLFQ